tara:strand:+ start:4046 stop:4501 length:456 start_codon:yes stop_codon:yes gene_type:complete
MILRFLLFLIINFLALYLGMLFSGEGGASDWYYSLTRAPWEPQGWVFGAAWTTIMICFAFYMSISWINVFKKKLILLYLAQLVLNISWSPIFFNFHNIFLGLITISSLTFLIGYILYSFWRELKLNSVFILPYLFWLIVATSLNGYIFLNN